MTPWNQSAWNACQRGDKMLRYVAKMDADRRVLVLAACECAKLTLDRVEGEDRPRLAIETVEAWARGEASSAAVRKAADGARAAAVAARERRRRMCADIVRKHLPEVPR